MLIAEDQAMIRQAMAALLSFEADIEVLAQVGRRGNRACQHFWCRGTVRNYLSACIQKTGARNHAEALRIAEERGWLSGS